MTGYEMQTELMNKNNHDTIVAYGPRFTLGPWRRAGIDYERLHEIIAYGPRHYARSLAMGGH